MTVTARCARGTRSSFWRATEASPSRKVRPTGLRMNSGVETAAMAALHQPSDLVMSRPGHNACRSKPDRSSSALVRLPCGSASRRLALSSSRRVRSMGPTVIPRKNEVLTLAFSGIIPAPR